MVGQERLDQLFPLKEELPPDGRFELGLVLGGTVSAGAYTAGALDALLEALETFYARADRPHDVVVRAAAGSSGGAVCASILGLLSSRVVPHVTEDATQVGNDDNPVPTGNPLWDLWVNEFRIERLLALGDMRDDADAGTGAPMHAVQHVPSLLNCTMIDEAGAELARLGASPSQPRPYFAAPFRMAVTIANLRGIPYQIQDVPPLGGFSGTAYVQHDDFAWFAFPNGASPDPQPGRVGKREDEFWLSANGIPGSTDYATLVGFATASGAMPVGLAARSLVRPLEHYVYRPKVRATMDAPGYRIDWPQPDVGDLEGVADGTYAFTAVDGGTFNNDPVTLVHRAVSGLIGINPRGKSDAKRALLMIDPLADQPTPIKPTGKSLLAVVESIVGSTISAARYLTADMELFANEDVFSRFQLVPFRTDPPKLGEKALAGSTLFAAAGWCARAFRVHDFLLGRQNMQYYLRSELLLAGDNPLFTRWSDNDRIDHACDVDGNRIEITGATARGSYFLPIIPIGEIAPQPVPAWPKDACDPDKVRQMLSTRLKAVVDQLVSDNVEGALLPLLLKVLAVPQVTAVAVGKVVDDWTQDLRANGLAS
jgi:hypothetical protein